MCPPVALRVCVVMGLKPWYRVRVCVCCRTVLVGKVPIGSEHPIACQTMCTTDTRDVMATVEQVR
jgi:hypothetical protein